MIKLYNVHPTLQVPSEITIVGSSKIILKKKIGKEIDKSNFVVRFNFANTNDFIDYTGSKTSLMVINNHVYSSLKKNLNKIDEFKNFLVISPNEINKFNSSLEFFFFEKRINQLLLSLKFIRYFKIFISLILILIKKNFSVGFSFILLALASGVKLNIFGFDLNEDMDKREHYYKKQKIGGVHDLVSEHKILKKLKDLGIIKIC
tara:strand:- start:161 stop:772 length:612 start_codon:yes stop_codon:yes gene_type:complete